MYRAFALSVSVVAMTWAATAAADSPRLRGSFGFTATGACLVAPGHFGDQNTPPQLPANPTPGVLLPLSGFKPNLQPNDAVPGSSSVAFSHSFTSVGIRKFNGDGTGTVKGTTVGITVRPTPGPNGWPHFPASAGSEDFSFLFTYTVDGAGGWTATMVPGSYTQTFVTGPRTGQTSTVDAIPPVTGMISQDGQTLIAAQTSPVVETHTFSNGDIYPQICHRSRVYIKLQNHDDDDDRR
jgi:hypothetical protein